MVGKSITQQVYAGKNRFVPKVTRVLKQLQIDGLIMYKVKIMTPGYGAIVVLPEEYVKKIFNADKTTGMAVDNNCP